MSQIDKIIYLPLLFWFIFLIFLLYSLVFNYFIAVFSTILKVRVLYYKELKLKSVTACVNFKRISFTRFLIFSRLNILSKNLGSSLIKLRKF